MSEDMAHKPFSFVEQKRCIRSQGAKIFFYMFSTNYYVLPILSAPMYFSQIRFKYIENLARVTSIFSKKSKLQ